PYHANVMKTLEHSRSATGAIYGIMAVLSLWKKPSGPSLTLRALAWLFLASIGELRKAGPASSEARAARRETVHWTISLALRPTAAHPRKRHEDVGTQQQKNRRNIGQHRISAFL